MTNKLNEYIDDIAELAHEANRAYCFSLGDASQPRWANAPDWQIESAVAAVCFHYANPDATAEEIHRSWLAHKDADGWKYGPVKDVDKKEHPCFVQYEDLPEDQRIKDHIYRAVVRGAFAYFQV